MRKYGEAGMSVKVVVVLEGNVRVEEEIVLKEEGKVVRGK